MSNGGADRSLSDSDRWYCFPNVIRHQRDQAGMSRPALARRARNQGPALTARWIEKAEQGSLPGVGAASNRTRGQVVEYGRLRKLAALLGVAVTEIGEPTNGSIRPTLGLRRPP